MPRCLAASGTRPQLYPEETDFRSGTTTDHTTDIIDARLTNQVTA